ncbi:MAG TPA: hypothetical protein HPQ00_00005, partial [Magnetococcales bacterium]|nr:hypothetical protein [Magnetococcales bacterium]
MTNRRFLKIIFPIFGAVVCFSWMVAASAQAQQPLVIVNDKSNVLHHVAGNALCQLDPQSSCKTVQADGEVGSIEQLLGGKAQLAVVTSESAYQAWMGQLPFKG